MIKITAKQITKVFVNHVMKNRSQNYVFPNVYLGSWEADILEITTSKYSYEYEIKTSKADFKADAKKCGGLRKKIMKSEVLEQGKRVNHFYYLVPEGLLTVEEIPSYAGLIYAIPSEYQGKIHIKFEVKKISPRLSKTKTTDFGLQKLLLSTYFRFHKLSNNESL